MNSGLHGVTPGLSVVTPGPLLHPSMMSRPSLAPGQLDPLRAGSRASSSSLDDLDALDSIDTMGEFMVHSPGASLGPPRGSTSSREPSLPPPMPDLILLPSPAPSPSTLAPLHTLPSSMPSSITSFSTMTMMPSLPTTLPTFPLLCSPLVQLTSESEASSTQGPSSNSGRCKEYRKKRKRVLSECERELGAMVERNRRLARVHSRLEHRVARIKEFYIHSVLNASYKCLAKKEVEVVEVEVKEEPVI